MTQTTNDQARGAAHAKSLAEQQGSREDKHAVANEAARQQEGSDATAQQGSKPANNEERQGKHLDDSAGKSGPQGGQGQFGSQAPFGGGPKG